MPLQIRRGTTAQRLAITPLTGELIHDTTTGQLFVGNGATAGGVTTTGISSEDAADAAASLFSTGSHSGITFAYNDAAGRIDATVTVAATGPFDGDLTGSVFADNSTLLVDGTNGALVGPIATSGNSNFGNNTVDGNIYVVRNTALTGRFEGITFAQHHETPDATNLTFYRTRGTSSTPTPVVDGDRLGDIVFLGSTSATTGATVSPPNGAVISAFVEGSILNTSNIPTKLRFATNNGTAFASRAELSATGIWKTDNLGALLGTTINVVDNNTITLGDVRLSQDGLSTINTNASLILSANGTGSVDIESVRIQGNTISVTDSTILNIESLQISGSTISTTDSSGITVSQATTFSSNLTVDGTLTVGDSIVQNSVNQDYVSTTLQTQGLPRVVQGVHNGTYFQLASSTAETFSTISYNSTSYRGCRATIKASYGNTNVFIGEVLLANTTTAVTIVNAQATAATIGTSPISSVTADYNSATSSIRLRPVTSSVLAAGADYNWTVSYQLFT